MTAVLPDNDIRPRAKAGEASAWVKERLELDESDKGCVYWPFKARKGRAVHQIDGHRWYVQTYLTEKFVGPRPEGGVTAPVCGDLMCCNKHHMAWGQRAGRPRGRRGVTGEVLAKRGPGHPGPPPAEEAKVGPLLTARELRRASRLAPQERAEARRMYAEGWTIDEIVDELETSRAEVFGAVR